jgi:hypothetical protein
MSHQLLSDNYYQKVNEREETSAEGARRQSPPSFLKGNTGDHLHLRDFGFFWGNYAMFTSSACKPFGPVLTVKLTRAPSSSDL